MALMENKEFALKIAQVVLRHPPISSQDEIVYEDERYRIVIEPVSELAWKLFLSVLALGRKLDEGKRDVVYEVLADRLYGALRTENMSALDRASQELIQCLYKIEDKVESSKYLVKFLTFAKLSVQDGKLVFYVSKSFEELREQGLWYYFVFSYALRSPSALNLHAFLSANTNLKNAKENTLLQRARITINHLSMARKYLTSALDELVSVGFLKGYHMEKQEGGRVYVLDRPDTLTLKAKAQEWLRKLYETIEEFKERRRKTKRESARRKREKSFFIEF